MQFNSRYGWIPVDYLPKIKFAYDKVLASIVQQDNRKILIEL